MLHFKNQQAIAFIFQSPLLHSLHCLYIQNCDLFHPGDGGSGALSQQIGVGREGGTGIVHAAVRCYRVMTREHGPGEVMKNE